MIKRLWEIQRSLSLEVANFLTYEVFAAEKREGFRIRSSAPNEVWDGIFPVFFCPLIAAPHFEWTQGCQQLWHLAGLAAASKSGVLQGMNEVQTNILDCFPNYIIRKRDLTQYVCPSSRETLPDLDNLLCLQRSYWSTAARIWNMVMWGYARMCFLPG